MDSELRQLAKKAVNRLREDAYVSALVGKRVPGDAPVFEVIGLPDSLHVTIPGKTTVVARNQWGAPQILDYPVLIKQDKQGKWTIVGRDTGSSLAVPDGTSPDGVLPHTLGSHSDTDFTGITDGQAPLWDAASSTFIPGSPSGLTDTDDLPEGSTNLYFLDERAQDAVGLMVAGNTETGIAVTYDDGTNKLNFDAQTAGDARYAPIAKGVTNGDSHDHNGGDGAQIAYSTLSGLPTVYTQEQIEDFVGGMVSSNTETGIAVTYDDSGGKLNFDAQTAGDARYGQLAAANTWTANNAFNSIATSGNALSIIRNLAAASTDAAVVGIHQDHASDDQAALDIQQDGTGSIVNFYDAATRIFAVLDGGEVRLNNATATSIFMRFAINEVNKAYLGVAGATNALVAGAVLGDLVLRTVNGRLIVTNDDGLTAHVGVAANGQVTIGTLTPLTATPLTVANAFAKATASANNVAAFGTNDGASALQLAVQVVGSATAGNRTAVLQSIEQTVAVRSLALNPYGGNVGNLLLPLAPLHWYLGTNQNLWVLSTSSVTRIAAVNDAANAVVPLRIDGSELQLQPVGGKTLVGIPQAAVGGTKHVNTTAVSTTTAGEDDLITYTLPAGVLSVNNQCLELYASGSTTNPAGTKTLRLKWDGVTIFTHIFLSGAAYTWDLRMRMYRTGAATQKAITSMIYYVTPTGNIYTEAAAPTATLSGAIILKFTGDAGGAGEMTVNTFDVRWLDAN